MYTKTARKILFIDCQILQTAAFDRGMGKYTISLIREVARLNADKGDNHEIRLIFSASLEGGERIKAIMQLIGDPLISYSTLSLPSEIDKGDLLEKERIARRELTIYLSEHADADITYLMTAPFFVGFPSVFPDNPSIKKVAIVYDITPQKIWHLQKIFPDNLYFNHYRIFIEADLLLTISAAVRDELVDIVGIPAAKIQHIDGGPMAIVDPAPQSNVFDGSYTLMVTGAIIHKNNLRAVRAFHKFNQRHQNKYTLYITSTFGDEEKNLLRKIDKNVVFTGNISDAELGYGYSHASVVLFPSLAEGLGMPVLEAALYGASVACSDIPVLSELGKNAFVLFDPTNIDDIARALDDVVVGKELEQRKNALAETVSKYTWSRTAELLLQYCHNAHMKELTKRSVVMRVTSVGDDTAGAELANFWYLYLSNVYDDVRLQETAPSSTDKIPSIARYINAQHSEVVRDHVQSPTYIDIADPGSFF